MAANGLFALLIPAHVRPQTGELSLGEATERQLRRFTAAGLTVAILASNVEGYPAAAERLRRAFGGLPGVHLLFYEKQLSRPQAINALVEYAREYLPQEYYYQMDADDLLAESAPDWLQSVCAADAGASDLIAVGIRSVLSVCDRSLSVAAVQRDGHECCVKNNHIPNVGYVYHRRVFGKVAYPCKGDERDLIDDVYFRAELDRHKWRVSCYPADVYVYRKSPVGMQSQVDGWVRRRVLGECPQEKFKTIQVTTNRYYIEREDGAGVSPMTLAQVRKLKPRIPKVIHFVWLGGAKTPLAERCIASWRQAMPGYELREWSERNFDIGKGRFCEEAYRKGDYAHVADYIRFYALYHYGGLYLDCDVEAIKPFDDLLENEAFIGVERDRYVGTAVLGAVKGSRFAGGMASFYEGMPYALGGQRVLPTDVRFLSRRISMGMGPLTGEAQQFDGLTVYPREYFYPSRWEAPGEMTHLTDSTHAVHHFAASWKNKK